MSAVRALQVSVGKDGEIHIGDDEVDAVLAEAGGDAREAIRMVLHDLAVMAHDADSAASRGYLRGKFSAGWRKRDDG